MEEKNDEWIQGIGKTLEDVCLKIAKEMEKLAKKFPFMILEVKSALKKMNDVEFKKYLQKIQDDGARKMAIRWRNEERSKENEQSKS